MLEDADQNLTPRMRNLLIRLRRTVLVLQRRHSGTFVLAIGPAYHSEGAHSSQTRAAAFLCLQCRSGASPCLESLPHSRTGRADASIIIIK
jgi:hypothetical protein